MGTRGSIATMNILEEIQEETKTEVDELAEKFIQVFQSPTDFMRYLKSPTFANDLIRVCQEVSMIFEEEPKCLFMQSPVYVLGQLLTYESCKKSLPMSNLYLFQAIFTEMSRIYTSLQTICGNLAWI